MHYLNIFIDCPNSKAQHTEPRGNPSPTPLFYRLGLESRLDEWESFMLRTKATCPQSGALCSTGPSPAGRITRILNTQAFLSVLKRESQKEGVRDLDHFFLVYFGWGLKSWYPD